MVFDADLTQEIGRRAKAAIRARMRAVRQALPPAVISAKSEAVCRQVLSAPEFRAARGIALYAALKSEVAVALLDTESRTLQKRVYYPFMDPKPGGFTTGFRRVEAPSQLIRRGGGKFLEPPEHLPLAHRGDIDLVVVPAVAVSADGYRLGYGSGFYDATLPDVSPPATLLLVAFHFQLLAELPVEEHDVPVHVIVTDERIVRPPVR